MAQQIITLCDPCLMEGKEAPAQTWGVTISAPGAKGAPYEIDVCDVHAAPFRALVENLGETGRRADRRRPLPTVAAAPGQTAAAPSARAVSAGAAYACPADGCGYVSSSASGLRSHATSAHGLSVSEMTGDASIPCPQDGCDRAFKGWQGVSSHLRTVHGFDVDRARTVVASARAAA